MPIEPDPFSGVEERLTRQGPALQIEQFGFASIALNHDVLILPDTLNFLEGCLELEDSQVVKRADRHHKVEVLVAKGISILGPVVEQVWTNRLRRIPDSVL